MAEIAVQIGADVSKLLDSLSKSEKALSRLGLNIGKVNEDLKKQTLIVTRASGSIDDLKNQYKSGSVTLDFYNRNLLRLEKVQKKYENSSKDLSKSLRKLKSDYKTLGGSTLPASKGITKMGRSSANAVPALTEFSRIVQDAPFGIQGMANNITQATQNFFYLSKNVGGSTNALKAMLSALGGPAGMILTISAVTSLMVSYGDEILNVIKGNDSLAASQKAVGKALNDFYGNQVTKINTYVSILEDANTSETQRKDITNELIKIVPSLTKADFAYGNNLDIVRAKIGNYVLAQASRIEADTLVEENSEKLAKKARIIQIQSIDDQQKRIEAFRKFLDDEGVRTKRTSITSTYASQGQNVERKATKDEIVSDFNKFVKEIEDELEPIQERLNELYSTTFDGGLGEGGTGSLGDKSKRAKIKPVFDFELPQDLQAKFDKYAKGAISILKDSFKIEGGLGSELINVDAVNTDIQRFIEAFKPLEAKLTEIPLQTQIFTNALSNSFSALSSQITASLETGNAVIDSFVSSIIGSLGRLLAEMVATSIAEKAIAGTKIATNKAVATSAAISAGAQSGAATGPAGFFTTPGFIAGLLAVVGGAFAGLSSFAKGGFSGDDNLAFLNKNELVLRPMEQAALYNAIRGRSFSSIGSDGSNTSNAMGDNIIGTATLRGSNQYIQFKRSQRKMNRFYSS